MLFIPTNTTTPEDAEEKIEIFDKIPFTSFFCRCVVTESNVVAISLLVNVVLPVSSLSIIGPDVQGLWFHSLSDFCIPGRWRECTFQKQSKSF